MSEFVASSEITLFGLGSLALCVVGAVVLSMLAGYHFAYKIPNGVLTAIMAALAIYTFFQLLSGDIWPPMPFIWLFLASVHFLDILIAEGLSRRPHRRPLSDADKKPGTIVAIIKIAICVLMSILLAGGIPDFSQLPGLARDFGRLLGY